MNRRVLVAMALLLAGCSGGRGDAGPRAASGSASPALSVSPSGSASPTGPGQGPGQGSAPASAAPATPGPSGIAASPPRPSFTPAPGSGAPVPVRAVTATGRYPASQTGSESFSSAGSSPFERRFPPSTELVVAGSGSERVFTVAYSPDRTDRLTLRFAGGRIDLVRAEATIRVGEYTQTQVIVPTPPIPVFPAGARAGQRYSGTFTSPRSAGNYDGAVLRREGDAVVVELTIRLTSGDITGTMRSVTSWDVARALPVRQENDSQLGDALNTYRQRGVLTLTSRTPR